MESGLKGKVALVTAASKGIGKAVASSLASEGVQVAICSRDKENLVSACLDIKNKYGNEPYWCVCDLNNLPDIENCYDLVKKNYGRIDILVNNCGGPVSGIFLDLSEKDWANAFEQVLLSVVRFSRLVIPDMLQKEWGRIINITSYAVKEPIDNLMLSNSLRSGVIGFAKTMSNEFAKYNITINNVAPGRILTSRLYDLAVEQSKRQKISHEKVLIDMTKEIPMSRLGSPEEIASVVSFLASNLAGYVTGNTIHVDGGLVKGLF